MQQKDIDKFKKNYENNKRHGENEIIKNDPKNWK